VEISVLTSETSNGEATLHRLHIPGILRIRRAKLPCSLSFLPRCWAQSTTPRFLKLEHDLQTERSIAILPHYTASEARRLWLESLQPWKPKISHLRKRLDSKSNHLGHTL